MQNRFHPVWRLAALLLTICALGTLVGCGAKKGETVSVLVDGEVWNGGSLSPESGDRLRVYITLDGGALIDLPFGEAHTVTILQPDGSENVVSLTGNEVRMLSANCDNQDCVEMGAVTRDNVEVRVMGGFIICLPHRISVEVRGK